MIKNMKTTCLAAFLLASSFCVSCAPGIRLHSEGAGDSEITGNYRVILNGCNFLNDLETIAFLDKEGDQYTFEPYTPAFNYRVKKEVAAADAVAMAQKFVDCNTSFKYVRMSRISTPNGDILGYEIRPLYRPFTYGVDDVLYTAYILRGDKVVITIRLVPSVKRMLENGDGTGRQK
jgi:hypothetical protein